MIYCESCYISVVATLTLVKGASQRLHVHCTVCKVWVDASASIYRAFSRDNGKGVLLQSAFNACASDVKSIGLASLLLIS